MKKTGFSTLWLLLIAITMQMALMPVSAYAQNDPTTIHSFSIVVTGDARIDTTSKWVLSPNNGLSIDSTSKLHMEVYGTIMEIRQNGGTSRINLGDQTDARAPGTYISVWGINSPFTGTYAFTCDGITKSTNAGHPPNQFYFPLTPSAPVQEVTAPLHSFFITATGTHVIHLSTGNWVLSPNSSYNPVAQHHNGISIDSPGKFHIEVHGADMDISQNSGTVHIEMDAQGEVIRNGYSTTTISTGNGGPVTIMVGGKTYQATFGPLVSSVPPIHIPPAIHVPPVKSWQEVSSISPTDKIPTGWVRSEFVGTEIGVMSVTITRYDNLPVGSLVVMIQRDAPPAGWIIVDKSPDFWNARMTIRRIK